MDASSSSSSSHLRRRIPHSNSGNDGNVDNDPVHTAEAIMATRSVDARQSSSSHRKMTEPVLSFNLLSAASDSASFETAHEILSGTELLRRTSSKNLTSPLRKQIFLSHSSEQGSFVEQLNEDLRNAGFRVFFHKDPGSLPKGEKFPERILRSARECDVAVVVLSEKYLLSKWPMLELATFVNAQESDNKKLKILPLFYKLEISALKDESMQRRMSHAWNTYAKEDPRIDPTRWRDAVRILSGINGEAFDKDSEVAIRKTLIKNIYNLCIPEVEFAVTDMEGKERLCQFVAGELEKKLEEGTTAAVGVHGMSGMGKTMLCKALCNNFKQRFYGRVCYVDFGSGDTIGIKKEILRRLTDLKSEFILDQYRYEEQVDMLLQELLPQQDVFVAIDNLPPEVDSLVTSVARILESLSKGSMSIVTSRSSETLKKVSNLDRGNIKPLPSLTEAEAMHFFVRVALPMRLLSSLTPDELEVVRTCVNLCVSLKHFSFVSAYHPLALKAFGNSLKEVSALDPLEWDRQQAIPDRLADDDLTKIYEIVDGLYNTLHDADKLLFMDVAVFTPPEGLFDFNFLLRWLSGVHDTNERDIRRRLRRFETLSLVEMQEATFQMHDFYIDFAHYKLQTVSDIIQERCVFKEGGDPLPHGLQSRPSGDCWERLARVRLQVWPHNSKPVEAIYISEESLHYRFPGMKLREWANLIVLHLEFGGEDIDIGALRCLRALHLEANHNLKTFTCSNPLEQLRFVNFKCWNGQVKEVPSFTSTRLQILDLNLDMVPLARPVTLPPASTALTVLRLVRWYSGLENHELDFAPFPNLVELVIVSEVHLNGYWKLCVSGLGALTKLKKLVLRHLPIVGPLLGMERLTNLEELVLRSSCSKNMSLPELDCFPNLRHLSVSGTDIQELRGLKKLLKLQELYCVRCVHLRSLPDLSALPELYLVNVRGCTLLENVTVPDCCGYMPPEQDLPNCTLSEVVVKSMDVPWAAIMQRAVRNKRATDPTLSETDVEDFQKDCEGHLKRLRNLVQQNLDHGAEALRHPLIQARLTANGERAERDRAQHHWDHLNMKGKAYHIIGRIAGNSFAVVQFKILLFLLFIYLLSLVGSSLRWKIIIGSIGRTLCEVITGADWVVCERIYISGCSLIMAGLRRDNITSFCI